MQLELNAKTVRQGQGYDAANASEAQLRGLQKLGRRQVQIQELTQTVTERAQRRGP